MVEIKLSKKFGTLCLLDPISVVTSSLAVNLVSLEGLFISLSNKDPFVKIMHFFNFLHLKNVF